MIDARNRIWSPPMTTLEKKHPLAVRWFHWINVPLLFVMLWSGLLIYWANDVYRLGLGDSTLIHFFPDWFYTSLGVPFHLAQGMALHFFFMWFFAINGVLYVAYTGLSGEWRYLVPNRQSFAEALRVLLHDLHLKNFELPARKFNGAQQIAYTSIIADGRRFARDGCRDLQAGAVGVAYDSARRLRVGALGALLAGDRLRRVFRHPHHAGDQSRVEHLPRDGHGLRSRAGGRARRRGNRSRPETQRCGRCVAGRAAASSCWASVPSRSPAPGSG